MGESLASILANQRRAAVVAPAGCGKTYLISESVLYTTGCQLILTHTHAGVTAIRANMRKMCVPTDRYRVATLDSFALNYAKAFPTIAEVSKEALDSFDWPLLRRGAGRAVQAMPVRDIVQSTYAGIFVDEYQDCDKAQHDLVASLATFLPCRIVGDPWQAIFRPLHKAGALCWSDALGVFPQIGTLTTPHRWLKRNLQLGHWLLSVRQSIEKGQRISLVNHCVPGLNVVLNADYADKLKICRRLLDRSDGKSIILRQFPNQCHALASQLRNCCTVFEDIQCSEIERPAGEISTLRGRDRANAVIRFAHQWLASIPPSVRNAGERMLAGKDAKTKDARAIAVVDQIRRVMQSDDLLTVDGALAEYERLKPTFKSHEVWQGIRKGIRAHDPKGGLTLLQTVQRQRDALRRVGRQLPKRSLATPLLVKGLECEHSLIFDLDAIDSPEALYVSLTRASTTLTLIAGRDFIPAMNPAP